MYSRKQEENVFAMSALNYVTKTNEKAEGRFLVSDLLVLTILNDKDSTCS